MLKYSDVENLLLKVGILAAGIILGGAIAYGIFLYHDMEIQWQFAIIAFILILPFSFFLQVILNVKSTAEERITAYQQQLRNIYTSKISIRVKQPDLSIAGQNIQNDVTFKSMFDERAEYLGHNMKLYNIYQESYEMYSARQEQAGEVNIELRSRLLQLELRRFLPQIVQSELKKEGIDAQSYLLPLLFFMFIYFAGFLIALPLINSVFTGDVQTTFIPLFEEGQSIPLLVVQWGFLGGFTYTSINLLSRFLRKDLTPRVYLNASFRLLLSSAVAVVIYLLYTMKDLGTGSGASEVVYPQILLACFLAGVAPIQLLVKLADTQLSRISGWRRRRTAGNRPVTLLDGINAITSERLGDEGIDCIQHMALSNYVGLSIKTKYPSLVVKDWKEQAVLYLLLGDIEVSANESANQHGASKQDGSSGTELLSNRNDVSANQHGASKQDGSSGTELLIDRLVRRFGIRTFSALKDVWEKMGDKEKEQKSFFVALGMVNDVSGEFELLRYFFGNVIKQGNSMIVSGENPIES